MGSSPAKPKTQTPADRDAGVAANMRAEREIAEVTGDFDMSQVGQYRCFLEGYGYNRKHRYPLASFTCKEAAIAMQDEFAEYGWASCVESVVHVCSRTERPDFCDGKECPRILPAHDRFPKDQFAVRYYILTNIGKNARLTQHAVARRIARENQQQEDALKTAIGVDAVAAIVQKFAPRTE